MYLKALFVIHVAGAIIGFGPTFTFALLGPMAGKRPGPGGFALMEGMMAIDKKLVIPVAAFFQPVSGVLLIFGAGWSRGFFSHEWLWISIILFATAFYIATFVNTPALEKMILLAKEGKADSPEFAKAANRTKSMGPVLTVLLVVIILLMILKPGG